MLSKAGREGANKSSQIDNVPRGSAVKSKSYSMNKVLVKRVSIKLVVWCVEIRGFTRMSCIGLLPVSISEHKRQSWGSDKPE